MKQVILHPEAEVEIEEAADFYEGQRIGYGELFRQEVDAALTQIGTMPSLFSKYQGGPT